MASAHIGTLNEGSLHAQLKKWYWQEGDEVEIPLDGFVIDLVRGEQLIEIQTGSLGAMKRKLRKLLPDHPIRVVHPIPQTKWIIKCDPETGEMMKPRRSPKKGSVYHLFTEMVYLPQMMQRPNFSLEVLLIEEEDIRHYDHTRRYRRRRGWLTADRRLKQVVAHHRFHKPADLAALLPDDLPRPFDTAELADGIRQRRRTAQKMAYCLRQLGVIESVGKRGNAILYHVVE